MYTEPLDRVLITVKGDPSSSWTVILGRFVVGWLRAHSRPENVDLILANPTFRPGHPGGGHTEAVLDRARRADLSHEYPFSPPDSPPLIKTADTPKSKAGNFEAKLSAARALGAVLALPQGEAPIRGKRIIVYDDILTTGAQLDVIARYLKTHGAASVSGLVVARVPWKS